MASLSSKLLAAYLAVLLISIAFLATFSLGQFESNLRATAIGRAREDLRTTMAFVEKNRDLMIRIVRLVALNQDLAEFLLSPSNQEPSVIVEFNTRVLAELLKTSSVYSELRSFLILHDLTALPEKMTILKKETKQDFEDLAASLSNLGQAGQWDYRSDPAGARYVRFRAPLTVRSHLVAVVELTMGLDRFLGPAFAGTTELPPRLAGFDEQGARIFPSDDFTDFVAAFPGDGGGTVAVPSGHEVAYAASSVPEVHLNLAAFSGPQDLEKQIGELRATLVGSTILLTLILAAVTTVVNLILFRNVRKLTAAVKLVQTGRFDVDVPVYTKDEIGQLALHFRTLLEKMRGLISTQVRQEVTSREAELRSLHNQINAHFLHNALETIKMMALVEGQIPVADALTALGRLFRYTMAWKRDLVPLEDELEYVSSYMKLMGMRYSQSIVYRCQVSTGCRSVRVPKMILQPLIENAIEHGLADKSYRGTITVTASLEGDFLAIGVEDDGVGMSVLTAGRYQTLFDSREVPDAEAFPYGPGPGRGIGLVNIHERLRLLFGFPSGLVLESLPSSGTRILVRCPKGGAS